MSDTQQTEEIRRRQRARAKVMALLLDAFVILMFGVSIAKMSINQ